MKTKIITLVTLLIVSLSQVMGQTLRTVVPPAPGAKRIFLEDFGTPPDHTTGTHTPGFTAYGINNASWYNAPICTLPFQMNYNNSNPSNGEYTIATTTKNSPYPQWWGSSGHTQQFYCDHTYDHTGVTVTQANNHPENIPGFMMVINAATNGDKFFEYPIKDLCPNTHLIFRVFVGNLCSTSSGNTFKDPDIQFDVFEPGTWATDHKVGALLATTDTAKNYNGVVPKTASPMWQSKSFEFNSGGASSIILRITDLITTGMGNDLVLDDIEVWLVPPIATIISPNAHCPGPESPEPLVATYNKDYVESTFHLATCDIEWLFSTDSTLPLTQWNVLESGLLYDPLNPNPNHNLICPAAPAAIGGPTGFYRTVIGNMSDYTHVIESDLKCEGISPPFQYTISPPDATLYWKLDPKNQNWNDPVNWLDETGAAVNYAPSHCTDVHIPGQALLYPSLDVATSGPISACNDIWFHFGGQIGRPHLLDYRKAYVQYDFGMDDGASHDYGYGYKGTDNTPFLATAAQLYSTGTPMARGQWYALAAPLQKIASGDFAVGGYPKTWQQGFISSPQTQDARRYGTLTGQWYSPENTDDWDVGKQYNAIAIWAGEVTQKAGNPPLEALGEGAAFQKYFDALKGIIEMPYFENQREIYNHYKFRHDATLRISYFPYFYNQLNSTGDNFVPTGQEGQMPRAGEAYRFIFQGPPFGPATVNAQGDSIYTMTVPTGSVIMVGNPFFSQLDFHSFGQSNGIDFYRLYNGSSKSFVAHSITAGSPDDAAGTADLGGDYQFIAPLQAFFISPTSASLKFNADSAAVADPFNNKMRSASASGSNMKPDVIYIKAESSAGNSYLTLSMQEVNVENAILLLPDDAPKVPQIYATDANGQKNSIQFEGGYVNNVPLGVFSTDSAVVTLTVQNADNMDVESLVLWDKYLDKKIDLKANDTYTFKNVPSVSDRFELIAGNKVITGITAPDLAGSIRANITGNTLYVTAVSGISEVSVISLEGITLSKVTGIGQNTYTQALSIPAGAYLVSVKTSNGETKVVKVVNK